jgi:hypothetical protein
MGATAVLNVDSHSHGDWQLAAGAEPPLAAHLVTPRGLYSHHGLYVGGGRVIHYGGLSHGMYGGPVEEVSLEDFGHGRAIWVRCGTPPSFDCERVIQRARSRLGEHRYRVLTNNCEHFCEWCLRGESRSRQVEAWRVRPRNALQAARSAISRLLFGTGRDGRSNPQGSLPGPLGPLAAGCG